MVDVEVLDIYIRRENKIPVIVLYSSSYHHEQCTFSRQSGSNLNNLKTFPRVKPYSNLCVHTWNAQSIENKTHILTDHILEYNVGIMFINKTWLNNNDSVIIGECTPPGYYFINCPRTTDPSHGGIAVVFKKTLSLMISPTVFESSTFEHVCVTDKAKSVQYVTVYRPPPSTHENRLTHLQFLTEIEQLLDEKGF